MKDIIKRFIGAGLQGLISSSSQLKLAAVLCGGLLWAGTAGAQVNDAFSQASVLSGLSGSTNGDNTTATLEASGCETNMVFTDDNQEQTVSNSLWYKWTAPASGTVEFDTLGSQFNTVLSAWTTPTTLCDAGLTNLVSDDDTGLNSFGDLFNTSYLTFQVVSNSVYYIAVDGNNGAAGLFNLNWAMTSIRTIQAGTFRFATGVNNQGGMPNFVISETEAGGVHDTSVSPSVSGARITVSRFGGASGRAYVDYTVGSSYLTNIFTTNIFGTNIFTTVASSNQAPLVSYTNVYYTVIAYTNFFEYYNPNLTPPYQYTNFSGGITNTVTIISNNMVGLISSNSVTGNFQPAPTNFPPFGNFSLPPGISIDTTSGNTNTVVTNYFRLATYSTNPVVLAAPGFASPSTKTLTFDDYQMSAFFDVPVNTSTGPDPIFFPGLPTTAQVTLSNPRLDPLESQDLLPPTIPGNPNALVSILSSTFPVLDSASVINFEKARLRVNENVTGGNAVITLIRSGGLDQAVTVNYGIDLPQPIGNYNPINTFPLQAGSDYATINTDFTQVANTVSFAIGQGTASFSIPINNDGVTEFNEDMLLYIYAATPTLTFSAGGNPPWRGATVGEINTATLTILFNDQPAGAADRTWNQNNVGSSDNPFNATPGTSGAVSDSANGNGGTVYAVATQPDGRTIIAGSYVSFDGHRYGRINRMLNNGYRDSSFADFDATGNSGANDFIAAMQLQPDGKVIIAGNFTSFNGTSRAHIARLNSDGTVDPTFNPGFGADGMIWSVFLQPNGQMVIGGEFNAFNTNVMNNVARLNIDGSVDTSFNPGAGPDSVVSAVAVDSIGRVIIGGDFDAVSGISSGGVARLNVDGSVDTSFNPGIGTYNPDTGDTDPINAIALQSNGQILIGGGFSYLDLNSASGIARLNTDGTVDTTFACGTGTYNPVTRSSDSVFAITLQPDGGILIGGDFQDYNQTRRIGMARLYTNGSLDTTFMDTAYNQFAGLINHYHNNDAVNPLDYPEGNQRNYVYAIGVEPSLNVIIGGGFLRVGGGTTRDAILPRSNVARLIGGATPGPGDIEFSYTSYSVDKNAGGLYVSLVRENGNLGIISATFNTNTADAGPGIAIPDVNFTLADTSRTPTWGTAWSANAWMYDFGLFGPNYGTSPVPTTGADVTVTVINDTNITGNLSANLNLLTPNGTDIFTLGGENIPLGVALGAQSTAPLTIIDDNIRPGVLGFSSVTYSFVENQANATITVVRTNGSDGVVTVKYKTSNGTATNLVDYRGVTNTLTFLSGVTSQTFTIPLINGSVQKPDVTVKLNLFQVTGGATLGSVNSTLTIINDNYGPGHLVFSIPAYSTNENAGAALITVNRVGGSSSSLSVKVIVGGGTAVNGVNYTASTNTLNWNNGEVASKNVIVPVFDDGVVTGNKTVGLWLTNSLVANVANSTPLLFGGTNATLTIVNVDSAGALQFGSPIYSVKKYGGFALIPVIRTGGSSQTITVDYTTVNVGSAQPGVNYATTNNTLTFTNGEVSKFITVPIIDDGTPDGLLYLNVALSNPTGGATLGSPSTSVLNIIDSTTINEPPGPVDVTYNATGFNNSVYALALQGNNKLLVAGDFTLANGVPRQRIARLNADGSLDTKFSLPSSAYGANGSIRALAVQSDGRIVLGGFFTNFNSVIANRITRVNPDGTLDSLFNAGSGADNPVYAAKETFVNGISKMMVGGSFATLAGTPINGIARLNYDGSLDTAFNPGLGANGTVYALAVQPTDGRIIIGGDFTAVNGNTNCNHIARLNLDGSVDTAFKLTSGASDSVRAIAIQPDGNILIGGLFTNVNGHAASHITRLNPSGAVDATFTPGMGASDAVFSIALQSDNRILLGGEFTQCSGVTRNRITRLNPDGTVDPTINFGTGANNFIAAMVVQQDTIQGYPANVPDEKIILGGGFTQYNGAAHPYLTRIYGGSIGGSGAFQFLSPQYTVDERGTNVQITVIRTGGTSGTNAAGTSDVQVPFATSDDTAFAGINYTAVATNLVFPMGEVIETVTIPVMDDAVITPDLTVDLTLSPLILSQVGLQPTAILTILNDDSSINFSSATYTVPKNVINGVAVIGVQRLGSVHGTASVTFTTTAGGTAAIGTDYTPIGPASITFADGVSNAIVAIPINNNGLPEGNRTVTMQLFGASSSNLADPSNAVLTIIDTVNAPGQLSFSATNYFVTEGGGTGYTNAIISVVRTFGSAGVVSTRFLTADGTALSGAKYISTNGILSFGDGETVKSFVVQVKNTTTAEGPQYLSLLLTNAAGGATLLSPTNVALTILNTNIGVAFTQATNTFSETGGTIYGGNPNVVFVSVTRFNNTNVTSSVNFSTADGTAVAGVNYTATSGTLTFNPGDSTVLIPVQLLHSTNVTGTLSFTVNLSSPSAGSQLTPPSTTVIQLLDAEAGISFLSSSTSVLKTAGVVILPVFSSNPGIGPVSVNYSTGGGTAAAGVDYASTSGTLTFTNGQSVNFIAVPILPNGLLQSNQTFNVTLSSPVSPGVLVDPSVETVTIIETNTPPGSSFFSPVVLGGDSGTTTFDTSNSIAFSGSPIGWFAWTPTNSGEVAMDTIGSVDDFIGQNLFTAMVVLTGTNAATVSEVAANEGLYPISQINEWGTHIFDLGNTNSPIPFPLIESLPSAFIQPYAGPSGVRFNAVAGQTYIVEVPTSPTGQVKLNWSLHPSGVFRFATEEVDQTGLTYSNGIQMLMYHVSETEGTRRTTGTVDANRFQSTLDGTTYLTNSKNAYVFDVPGLLVSVTRVAGSTGRVRVGYTTSDILPGSILARGDGYLLNGDLPASSTGTTNIRRIGTFSLTNTITDYTPVSGMLTFDDSEMSKTIFIPITDDAGIPRQNRDFLITLTNAVLDPSEATAVQTPRLDNIFNQAVVRIMDADINPQGGSQAAQITTNIIVDPFTLNTVTNTFTNTIFALQPTNGVFNFQKAHYRVTRDISDYWAGTPITVYVNRMGTNGAASPTIHWRVNAQYLDNVSDDLINGEFPLQPGSDYATPTPPNNTGVLGLVPDFSMAGNNYSGTISFPSGNAAFNPQPVGFTIVNNGLQQFNEDFTVSLYTLDKDNNALPVGMIDQTTVTILTDDNHPPAGSVDEFYNADFSFNMTGPFPTVPAEMSHPGADGEVQGLAVQPDNKTIIVGNFFSYDQTARNSIARINTDGTLDATFNPGSGLNSFAKCIVLNASSEAYVGGDFSSYNGALCNRIALITPNGTLDPIFNAGLGFNGDVNAMAFQTNGELLVGGNFTSYNGTTRHYLALIRADGSLDTSFDPGTNLNAQVLAIGVKPNGQVIVGGDFTQVGGISGQDHIAQLNADGTFDPSFDPGSGANASVFAIGVQPDGNIVAGGQFTIMNGATANRLARLTPGGFTDPNFYNGMGVDGPVFNLLVVTNAIFSTTNATLPVQTNFTVYVGGSFTAVNGTHRLGYARLNADGTVDTTFLDTAYNQFAGLPRDHYNDPLGRVLSSGLQSDGNVMIAGSFSRVGGGQSDDVEVRPESIDTNNVQIINSSVSIGNGITTSSTGMSLIQKTRSGIRNRNNIARLIGGATPGPGNIGLLYNNYTINKSQSPLNVSILRDNGTLGPASANFAVLPGLAQSGVDYTYLGLAPFYGVAWELFNPMGRMHSDGLFGTNGFVSDVYNRFYGGSGQRSVVQVSILENTNSLNNLNAQFQMANPLDADQLYLGGEDTPLGVALGRSVSPLVLIDDHHQAGQFGFSAANYVGAGQNASIAVTRTNGTYGIVYLSYTTTTNGSTAVLNSDYQASSGTLTFQPSDTVHTFNVTLLSTNSVSPIEKTVNMNLFGLNPPVNGLASLGLTNAVLRLINPNFQGFVNLSSNVYPAQLSAGSVTITVNRNVGSRGTLTVLLATTNGTAMSGTDYTGYTNTLTWNSGDATPKTIVIPLLNNGNVGGGKQFGVALSSPALNGISTPALFATTGTTNAVILINNNNSYGSFQFSSPSYVVNETGGYSLLTVIRNGGTNGSATVHFATANATAVAGVNYGATNGMLNFAPGQLAATIRVPILNDNVNDPQPSAFYFTVALSAPSTGAALGTPITANNYIVDANTFNRPPGSGDTAFDPGAGMNADVFALALQSSGKIVAGGSFTVVNGVPENHLARLNTDGSLDRSGFLYGLSGTSDTVYALADQTDDQILIGGAFTSLNGTTLNHIARLNQDGSLDSSFNPGAGADNTVYSIAEGFIGGARKIYVGGAFGLMNGQTIPFVARLNTDGTVDTTFNAGAGPISTVYAVATYPTNSVFAGKVLIGGAFTNVNNTVVGHIARLNADGSVDTSFSINVTTGAGDTVRSLAIQNDGGVVVGGDFTTYNGAPANHLVRLNSDGTVDTSFAAKLGSGLNDTVSALAIQADNRIVAAGQFTQANGITRNRVARLMPDGTVDASINFGDGANSAVDAVVIQPADQMLIIGGNFTQYNDAPANHVARIYGGSVTGAGQFQFTSAGYTVDENGLQAIIGIRRVGGTGGTNADGTGGVAVNFATSDGTAVAGINYSNVNKVVTFPQGEVLEFVNIPVRDDSNATPNLTVNLVLSNPTPPATLGEQFSSTLTIINDDSGVSFGSASYTVQKDTQTGLGNVHVVRLGSASGTASLNVFTSTNGTAVTNLDYYPTNVLVTFNPGQTDVLVQVGIINNVVPEDGGRTVILGMSNLVNVVQSAPATTVLTINDTVQAHGQLSFDSTIYTTNANAGKATITVIRTAGSTGAVTVNYATGSGTAVPGVNYTPTSGTLQFADTRRTNTFTVDVLNNNLAIGPVTLPLVLSNPGGGATLVAPTNATLTIINTNVVVAFTQATNTFSELAGVVPVTVIRYNNTSVTSTVKYATTDGTAFSNANYSASSGTLTFNPGDVTKVIPVSLLHNTNYSGTVAFNMTLFSPGNGVQTGTPNPTIIQITDAEAGISFTNSALSVQKSAGSITVTVICQNTNVEPVLVNSNSVPLSVNFLTADGTGINGIDYTAMSGTLVFTNGNGTNTFTVPILNNGLVNGNKTFSVMLTNPTAPGVLVAPSTAVVTIFDSNSGLNFSSANYSVNKSGGSAKITVLRTDNTNVTSTVDFVATNGTALAGLNFTATNGTLVFTNGVTSQSFYVPVSATTLPQPDLTVFMQLRNPTNGTLVTPSAATLTIHDDTGSFVIPAGSMLTSESGVHNGVIDPGETVTLQFAFRVGGGTNVQNLVAKIIPSSNVTTTSPVTNSYGPLQYLGHSVSRPFTFTAVGTNNQPIVVNFNLYDVNVNNPIGTAVFGYTLGQVTNSFTNTTTIVINDPTNATPAAASPYPSIINVSGVGGTLIKSTVTLNKLWHASPSDVDALVVSPAGFNTLIMAHVGGQVMVTNVTLTFDDASTNGLTHTGSATTSTNRSSVVFPVNNFH